MGRSVIISIVSLAVVMGVIMWRVLDRGETLTETRKTAGIVVYSDGEKHYVSYEDLLKGTATLSDSDDKILAYTPAEGKKK